MSKFIFKFINASLLMAGFLMLSPAAWCELGTEKTAREEFETKRSVNRERVENFYQRMIELDRLEAERRRGEEDMRKDRKNKVLRQEEARKEFVKSRKAKPKADPRAWEAEIKARQLAYEQGRKDYVRRRTELNRLLKTLGQIPEEDEYNLYLDQNEQE